MAVPWLVVKVNSDVLICSKPVHEYQLHFCMWRIWPLSF